MTGIVETLRRRAELVFGASASAHTRRKAGTLLVVAALFSVLLLPETAIGQSGPPQDRRPFKAEFLDPYLGNAKVELRWRHSALRTNPTGFHYEYLIYDDPLPQRERPWTGEDWKDIPGCNVNVNCVNVTSYIVTGLTNDRFYRFRVRAVNVRGIGLPSEEIRVAPRALQATLPGVSGLGHTVDRNSVRFSWSRSAVGVGNDLSYVYQIGNENAVDIRNSNAGTRDFSLELLPGKYTISIQAKNSNNNQLGTARTRTVTVQGPEAPKGLRAEVGDREVTLRWTQTTDNLVRAYEYLVVGSNRDWEYRGGTTPELRITRGLTNGQEYTFRLRGAGNLSAVSGTPEYEYGYGPFAEVTATPNPVLPAPADLEQKPGTQLGSSFTVQWTAVPDATGYVATATVEGSEPVRGTVTDTEAEFTGLSISTRYTVLVHATTGDTNYHPTGKTAILRVWTNLPRPSQPASLVIEAVNTDAMLRWTQSTDASIIRYEYRYRTDRVFTDPWVAIPNSDATTASHTVTGLANNTDYFFALRAVNLAGGGAVSNARVAIRTVPAAPADFMAEAQNQGVRLSWTPARDRSITRYEYTLDGGNSWILISTSFDDADVLLTGLANERTYTFQVRAVNAQGNGLASVAVMATPEDVPGVPRMLTADLADSQDMVTLRWQAPSSGGRVFRYEFRVDDSGWMAIPGGATTRSHVVTGLDEVRAYSLYVRAANEVFAGDGVSVSVQTLSVPAAPPDLALKGGTLGNTLFTVQWTSGLGVLEDYIGPNGDGKNSYSATATPLGGGTAVTGTVTKTGSGGSAMYEAAFTGLSANTVYIVLVHAIGDGQFDAPRGSAATVGVLTTGPLPTLSVADASVDEGDSGPANMEFTVTLSEVSSEQVTVDYATADGTATLANADYTMTSGTLTFAASTTSQIITVRVTGDGAYEDSETFTVTLSNPSSNAARAYWRATGTITNDEAPPTLSIADARVEEGDRGTTEMEFTVTLSEASGEPVTVVYATADGTATANVDYTVTSGTLTFAVGEPTTQTFNVLITGDGTYEPDESFTVVIRHPSGAMLRDATATGTIANDEGPPTLSLTPSNVSLPEGTSTARFSQRFHVVMSRHSSQLVTVDYATADGTATAGTDYIGISGTLTFLSGGITRKPLEVEIIADEFYENNEAFTISLSNPTGSGATISTTEGAATITIRNDDIQPALRIADASVVEGNSGTVTMEFTVTLRGASERQVTVDYATEDGTATVANADYTAANGTLTFAEGVATQTVTVNVPITGDEIYERDETLRVTLTLSNQSNVLLRRRSATGTITNDEATPIFSIADASVTEGNSGTTDMEFTVTMDLASGLEMTVAYATAGGTATEGTDYMPTSGTLTFAASETSKIFTVQITGDLSVETDETFTVALRNTSGRDARLSKTARKATGTIRSDDDPPALSIADASVTEGNRGTTDMEFTVTLGKANDQQVTVEYATAEGTALNTDYTATSGILTFPTGELTQTFTVLITGDETYEADETFTVTLRNPANVAISATEGTATGTINNDDDPPVLSIADASVTEGDSDTTMQFTVRLSAASVLQATVNYTTAGGGNATVGTDYTTVNGVLTFTPGVVTQTINVPITGDQVYELAETFTVTISAPTGATLGDATATGTINNDESAPILSFAPSRVSVPEGDSGSVSQMLTVTMSLASSQQVTVDYETAGGTGANAATANTDYTRTSGTLTFAPGDTSKTFTVEVAGDVIDENNETFTIRLSDASGSDASVSATSGTATVTIADNEGTPTLSIADASVTEGNSGMTGMEFTVTLSAASGSRVTVAYATADGTATVGDRDYSTHRGILTFDAGEFTQTVTVPILGDLTYEPDETFTVTLSNPSSNAELGDATATGTISNDESALVLRIDPTSLSVTEGDSGSVLRTFAVAMNFASSQRVTVRYATADGTGANAATDGRDYTGTRGTLTFTAGQTSKTITVQVTGDVIEEGDEIFTVALSDATGSNASISSTAGTATITIEDNEGPPTLRIAGASENEGSGNDLVFVVTLAPASSQQVTVNYATTSGTASAPADYTTTSGVLTFTSGTTRRTFSVPIIGDGIHEVDETLTVALSSSVNADISTVAGTATGTIIDDEAPPVLSFTPSRVSVPEGDSGSTSQTFTVTMSLSSSQRVTVRYATADGTGADPATADRDYTATSGTLTFAPGDTSEAFVVQVAGDTLDENDKTFTVGLSDVSGEANISAAGTATVTITDDDDPPTLSIANASASEGGRGASGNMEFTVTMSTESGRPVTVGYTTANGSATAGEDYRSASATLRFAAGTTMRTFRVPLIGDAIYEGDEAFTVALSNPSNATLADGEATGTITEDESPPILSITPSNSSVTEGGSGATPRRTFTVAMSLASSERVIVNYATVEGTGADAATEDTDYTATSGILTFAADETRKTVTVQVIGDVFDENDETFTVVLSDVSGSSASISTTAGTTTVTIVDDDASPRLSIADASIGEGNAGTTNMDFTVTLSAVSGLRVTVAYATADGTGADAATEDADYTAADGVLTFTAGTTVQTIRVPINGDEIYEGDESFTVVLSNPTNAVLADLRATGMIIDDEASLTLSLTPGNLSVAEGDSGSAPQIFTVSMNLASSRPVTVNYATADGTAVEGTDYTEASGALAFAPGETSQTFTVQVAGDVLHEGNEIFTVALSDVSGFGASISSTAGTATITVEDNEDPPDVSIAGASGGEGDSGTANLEFMVTLTLASGQQVTVDYETADGTGADAAIAGTDYMTTSGTLTFVAGETAQILNVPIIGDVIYETDETFTVTLSGPSVGSVLGDATVTGTITDDENEPTLSIAPSRVSVIEDGSGTTAQTFFTVNLAPASSRQVTVNYATADGSGAGAAIAGRDYRTATGTLTFAPGDSNKTFTVEIIGDDDENIENFTVRLSDASGLDASISTTAGTATVTIAELPVLSIADVSTDEGDSGNTPLVFTVSLTPASIEVVTVAYAATAVTATADADYTVVDGTLTFAASETTQTFTALIIGDNVFEPDESFTVTLSNPSSNAKILAPGATATGTITNDESVPGHSIEDATAEESDGMVFIVTLDPVSSEEVTVAYATADSTGANPATAGADYTATSGTLIFEPGQASRTITVQITEDGFDDDEEDETFTVTLDSETNSRLLDDEATGTIIAIDRPAIQEIGIQPPYFSDGYRGGEQIEVVVDFDIPVRYDENNPPSIALTFGDSSTSPPTISEDLYRNVAAQETDSIRRAFAYKVSNNGDTDRREGNSDNVDNDVVHFLYRVQPDDLDPDGIGIGENSLEGDIFPLETDKPVPFRNEHDEVMPTQELQVDGSKPFRPGQLFEDLVEEVESRSALAIIDGVARTISQRIRETGTSEQMAFSIASYEIGSISQAQKGLSRLLDPAKLGEGGTYKDIKPTMEQLFDGTSFVIPLQLSAGAADAARMEIWGRGSWQSMDGDDDRFDWDGTRRGAQLGMDARFHEKLLAGLVVSWSDGGFGYKDGRGEIKLDGSYDNRMLSVHPWMAWSTDEGLDLWASVGYGEGEFTIDDVNFDDITSDTTLQTVAAGASGSLLKQDALTIMLKGEGFLAKVDVDDGNISDVDANRVRLAAEGSWAHATDSGGRLTPSLELGLRLDGGDYSSGAGAEIGAGIMFVDHSDRLSLDLDGRFLVTDSDVLERGVSGVLRYTPNSAGRGLSFDMRSDWGASSSGMERLWESGASDMAENGLQAMLGARMQAEIGYGIGYASGLLKSYGGVELEGGGNARYFIGSRYTTPSLLELSFEGAHRTTDSESDPASSITLRGTLRW